jgi:hypothetical protein
MATPTPDRSSTRIYFLLAILGIVLAVYAWYMYLS